MQLKVMEYNVLHGFYSSEFPFKHEQTRQDLVVEVVKEQNPDVLILTEACFGKEFKGLFVDYEKLFGLPHHYHANKHYEHGVSILSRLPIKNAENFSAARVHFVRIQLDLQEKLVNLDVVHPHPELSEQEKSRFIRSVLRDIKHPYLLVGDFNACSPKDKYDKEEMIRSFSRFNKYATDTVEDLLTFRSIKEIESKGLVDTYKILHPHEKKVNFTVPTDLLSNDKGSGMRCDLIFCSAEFNVKKAGVIKNKLTEKASDHYPIYADLEV